LAAKLGVPTKQSGKTAGQGASLHVSAHAGTGSHGTALGQSSEVSTLNPMLPFSDRGLYSHQVLTVPGPSPPTSPFPDPTQCPATEQGVLDQRRQAVVNCLLDEFYGWCRLHQDTPTVGHTCKRYSVMSYRIISYCRSYIKDWSIFKVDGAVDEFRKLPYFLIAV
jgi:hypothetical protein